MKFLAFTDLHENLKVLANLVEMASEPGVELIVCTGDVSTFGCGLERVFRAFENLGKPFLFVPGNHEESCGYQDYLHKYPFVVDLHMKLYRYGGFTFMGHGGGGFAQTDDEFRAISKKWYKDLKGKKTVLLVHMPPFQTTCDKLNRHVGSKDYRTFIEAMQPVLVLCGHLHETFGTMDKIGNSVILNSGATGKIVEFD